MKLTDFRIQNYKGISDSGWIKCANVLALVGKNEAGKTSLIFALSKLNSISDAKYDGLKEFPRGRYTDEFQKQDWPVASAIFALSTSEREHLKGLAEYLAPVEQVEFTRHYSGQLKGEMAPSPIPPQISKSEWISALKDIRKVAEELIIPNVPEPKPGEAVAPAALAEQQAFQRAQAEITALATTDIQRCEQQHVISKPDIESARQKVIGATNDAKVRQVFQPFLDKTTAFIELLDLGQKSQEALDFLIGQMPKFLFFANYEMLTSNIYLPDFIRHIKKDGHSPELRVQQAMFKHVGADVEKLTQLSQKTRIENPDAKTLEQGERIADELSILASSAEAAMTEKFSSWWLQRDHRFRYSFAGEFFRVWVADDHNPAFVELEQRSEGFRYFFSFYLLFLVEASNKHKNAILLMDEPGLHLHGTAQQKLLEFFDKLAVENDTTVIYTTHSPFLIDGAHLERARAVFEGKNGTEVSSDVWPKDKDSLFPLQAALGYSICQALFVSKKQIVVEGATDYLLLCAANHALPEPDRLTPSITIMPVGGASNVTPFASLLRGHGVEFAALLDMDDMGQKAKSSLLKLIPDNEARITSYGQILGIAPDAELEDIMPDTYYISCLQRVYGSKISVPAKTKNGASNVVDRCEESLTSSGLKLEKHRVIAEIVADLGAGKASPELIENCRAIFRHLNSLFS